jgi:hypothetical protein
MKIPSLLDLNDRGLSQNFRGSLKWIDSYAYDRELSLRQECKALIKESDDIKEEFESIEIEEYDDRHSKDPDVDKDFDWGLAAYKEELEDEFEDRKSQAQDYAEYYPQILFESLFITIYSNLERYMHNPGICGERESSVLRHT